MVKKQPVNDTVYFSFEEEMEIPDNLPEWILNMIMQSREYNRGAQMQNDEPLQEPNFPLEEEEVPF